MFHYLSMYFLDQRLFLLTYVLLFVTMIAGLTAVVGMIGIATAQSFSHLVVSIFIAGVGSGRPNLLIKNEERSKAIE
ncbi:hypothetical protein [Shouchella patagoniensis]|uniref:hypothetical protein n=1 Tax=Shouchella patagoniensis TaxID=228576 RepID=UPI0009949394|nr:hypothetical protein [Shouchella patagoniensis]